MIKNQTFTRKALKIIDKKIAGKKLSQQDSNYLSRFVRPKLRGMASIDAEALLKMLDYNPRALSIERKIMDIVLKNVKDVDSIIICGSVIQTNYKDYNDIDIIIATKKPLYENLKDKNRIIEKIVLEGNKKGINLDIQIYSKKSILEQYSRNPSLIYQMKDSKVIHGNIKFPNKIILSNLDLKMKLDWSEGLDRHSSGSEIYYALRNAMLVLLLVNGKVDNYLLRQNLINMLGKEMLIRLKSNAASNLDRELSLNILDSMVRHLEAELKGAKWERIEIQTIH